jgi:hypothetical protein
MKTWQKIIAVISTFALLFNSIAAPLSVLAQTVDETPSPAPEVTTEATATPEATIEATATPEVTPTPDATPAETATPSPEITPVATNLVTPAPTDQPVETQAPESNPTTTSPPASTEPTSTPTATPEVPTETGTLSATILENTTVDTSALNAFDLSYQTDGSAVIVTDKLDYSPYDTAIITGSGFIAGKTYQLTVSSTDPEPTSTTVNVTASETGTIMYAYELDHTYRPNYSVVVKDLERVVARTTFTDAQDLSVAGTGSGTGTIISTSGTSYDCSYNGSSSSGTCLARFNKDDSVVFTATATGGSAIGSWNIPHGDHELTIVSGCGTGNSSCSVTMGQNLVTVTVTFNSSGANINTSTSVSSSTNPSTYGNSVTFTATVSHTSGSNSPTGTVNIKDDTTTTVCTTGSLSESSHTASCSNSALSVVGSPHSITAVYTGDSNYNGSTSGAISQVVNKKSVTASVTASNKTYNGNNNATIATCTLSGVLAGDSGNVTCATGSATFADKNVGNGKSVTATGITLSGTAAGNYQLSSTSASTTANITAQNITVTADAKSKVFGTVDPELTYQITSGSLISGDVFSGSLNRVTGENFGTYAIQKNTLSAGGNYNLTYVGANLTITKASSSVVVTFETGPYTYRGSAFTATANVTGAGGFNQSVGVVYSGDCVNVTSSNGCTATATFAGDANHNGSSDTKSITINKADANVTVNEYTGTYDGNPHGATGTATGIGGTPLTGLTLGASFTNVPGGTATWSFTNANYANETGTVNIAISKANQTISVTTHAPTSAANGTGFTVAATGGGSGNPVIYKSLSLDVCTNSGGTFTMTSGSGTCTVQFNQAGNTNYYDATPVTESISATRAGTTTAIVNATNLNTIPSERGVSYAVEVNVTRSAGTQTPTGNVTLTDGTDSYTNTVVGSSGTSSYIFSFISTTAGLKTLTATYNGDSNFSTSFGTTTHTVSPLGSISGTVWEDMNANGTRDLPQDQGFNARAVMLYKWDGSNYVYQTQIVTDSNGNYTFDNLLSGTYKVMESSSSWQVTYPVSGLPFYDGIILSAGNNLIDYNFGNYMNGTISGSIWNNLDADGTWDGGELGLSGWTVFIDKNNNNIFDAGDESTVTDSSGYYKFYNLRPGTYHNYTYGVKQIVQSGWRQTYPAGNPQYITVLSGTNATGVNFGNQYDIIDPVTTADAGSYIFGTWTNATNTYVTLSCSDGTNGSGCDKTYWCYDDGSSSCTPGVAGDFNGGQYVSALTFNANGHWYFRYNSVDVAGNAEDVQVQEIKIDQTAPTGIWVNPLFDNTVSGTVPLQFNATDSGSEVKSVAFEYSTDGWVNHTNIAAGVLSGSDYVANWNTTALDLGDYSLRAVITDNANNSAEKDIEVGVSAIISAEDGMGNGHTTAIVTWITDRPTKSRVVYDTVQHPVLDLTDPNYGYAYSTGTYDEGKVLSHAVTLSGLSAGTMYFYRTISEGSPKAISGEHYIITNTYAGPPDTSGSGGSVLGASTAIPLTTWPRLAYAGTGEAVEATESVLGTETQATPAPEVLASQSETEKVGMIKWMLTHKKITLGVIFGIIVICYLLRKRKKS